MSKLYDESSIESLSPLEFTRLRPGVYAGDTTYSTQLLVEILSNAIDEYRLAHGSRIEIGIDKDKVSCRDFGQGFLPNSVREDGKTILEAAFSVLNTSGKYRDDGTYEGTSLGSFGIGSKITTYLSHWLTVITYRDGQYEQIRFNEGVFEERKSGSQGSNKTGTEVCWQPSEEFFTNTIVEIDKVKDLLRTLVCLCKGLTIVLKDNGNVTEYKSENGLNDLVTDLVKDKELINNRLSIQKIQGKEQIDFVLTYTSNYSSTIVPYVNCGLTEKGPHITQIKTLLTREFNKFFREKGWLKDKDSNLTGDDVQEGLYIVFNLTAPNVAYNAQVKSTITKIEMGTFTQALTEGLQQWFSVNEKEVKIIADKAINARKAREAAKKAREAVRGTGDKKKSNILNLPTKLVDAWSKKRKDCELLICEGDSAASGLIEARDSEYQAVFPVRGKVLNLYKCTDEKAFANQEIVNLIKALGLDLDVKSKTLIYDASKLRYGSVILACDGDPDGEAIKNLLLTAIWSLCPELIINNHIKIAIPPLYRITTKKNEYIYLKDKAALDEYKNLHNGEKFMVNRNKGLGEQDSEELSECLLDPATRNIMTISVNNIDKTEELFEILMGKRVPPRREFLLAHAEEADI